MKQVFYFVFLILFICNSGYSQKAPIKFGDVSMEELNMSVYERDTTAPAVILCNYGYFRSMTGIFSQIIRIKILRKEGYDFTNLKFKSDFKSSLKGIISNLENGKIVQEKIKNDAIFKTRVFEDINYLSVAVPNVKVGSVVDFEFVIEGLPSEWKFQDELPVVYNELILEESSSMSLQKNFYGYEPIASFTPTRWIARNMPAFKKEPLMNSANNYISRLELDILEMKNFKINTDWQRVCELLIDYTPLGMQGLNCSFLNDLTKQLSDKFRNKEDLLRAAFDSVRQKVYWNQIPGLFIPDPNLGNIYKKGVGNSAQVNMILLKLLDKLGYEVGPVAMRTREDGSLSTDYASMSQLNYFIVYAKIGDKEYLLDATEKYMPYYLLPLRTLNGVGRLIDKQKEVWLPLTTSKKSRGVDIYDLNLEKDLTMKGTAVLNHYDYAGYEFRKKYFEYNSLAEYAEAYLKDYPGLKIKDITIDNLDSLYKPAIQKENVTIHDRVDRSGDNLYIIPAYFNELKENPFKLEKRKYPVDYGILPDKTLILNLTIPEGFSIVSLPESVTYKLKENAAVLMYQAIRFENTIKITAKFSVNKPVFQTNEYSDLREFYNQILKKLSEAIVLKQSGEKL